MNSEEFLDFSIPRHEVTLSRSRSGGAGGQHVNKVETKIELRFHLESADWIPPAVRIRFRAKHAQRLTNEGEFVLFCDETRSLHRNEEIAFSRLRELIGECWKAPRKRIKTKPTRGSKEKRLTTKKKDGAKKQSRRWSSSD